MKQLKLVHQIQKSLIVMLLAGILLAYSCQKKPYKQGERLYVNFCANCHMEDGSGLIGNIPPLADSDFFRDNMSLVPCIIRYGLADTIQVNGKDYWQPMTGIAHLTDIEISNIINYINEAWGNDLGFYPPDKVKETLTVCPE
ncbi:MAG: cytochrome c [Saprospiraceae bacterium]|nr:cytochrome c [Saprospiraceae bacterium]